MPLAIDLFCGLGGWTEGFLAEGWDVIGFDIKRHVYGEQRYPAQLVIQDVRTLHGSQFCDADCIVASPPCQEFSYMAMPWSRAKQIAAALRGQGSFPHGYTGSRTIPELRTLFDACFRIQREASQAAGRHISMVVENVKGAQPWVGKAQANFGSFYFWGDVRMHGGAVVAGKLEFGQIARAAKRGGRKAPGNDTFAITGQPCGKLTDPRYPSGGLKAAGVAHQRDRYSHTRHLTNQRESALLKFMAERYPEVLEEATKVPGISFSGYGTPGYKPQGFNVNRGAAIQGRERGQRAEARRGMVARSREPDSPHVVTLRLP